MSNKKIQIGVLLNVVRSKKLTTLISQENFNDCNDCNDSSSHGDSLLSSDSDGEYQVESGKTREHQTKKTSKQLRYYYRKTAGRAKQLYTPFADQENPSKQLKCYHAMKECETAAVLAERDLSLERDDENSTMSVNDENDGVFDDLREADADECNMTSSSDDLVVSASESTSKIESSEEDLQQQVQEGNVASASTVRRKNHSVKAANYRKCYHLFLSSHLTVLLGEQCKKTFPISV